MVPPAPKSCSSCRFRKIKCDRREKLQEANASDDSEVQCSNCQSSGTKCAFISAPPKQRLGKRIRALRDLQHDELLYGAAAPASSTSSIPLSASSNSFSQDRSISGGDEQVISSSMPSTSALPLELWQTSQNTPHLAFGSSDHSLASAKSSKAVSSQVEHNVLRPGMFGIRGLTKQLLESTIASYLYIIAPTLPIVRPDSFIPRLRAFFKLYSGEPPEPNIEPLDDLLVIASACAGSRCLGSDGPEAVAGSGRRFELMADLRNAFNAMVESENGERLKRAGLDGVAACYIIAVVLEDERWTDTFRQGESRAEYHSLKISPTSTEGVVRMGIAMGLHIRSQENVAQMKARIASTAQTPTPMETEGSARNRIWWCILGNDAFRALAYRRAPYIADDSFDHGGDGKAGEDDGKAQAISSIKGLPSWIIFEFQWLSAMVTMTFLARSILPRVLSERAQRRGAEVLEVMKIAKSLEKWRKDLPKELSWEAQHQVGVHGTGEAMMERAFKCRLRALYVECLFHFSVMGFYHGLEDAGFRHSIHQPAETASYLPPAVNSPISTASVRAAVTPSNSPASSSPVSPASDPLFSQTLKKVEDLASASFERLANLLPQAASEGMIRASTSVLRGVGTVAIIWATEIVIRRANEGMSAQDLNHTLNQAQTLISSVGTCDSSQSTPLIVNQMQDAVTKARNTVQEILSIRRYPSESTSSSTSSFGRDQHQSGQNATFDFSAEGNPMSGSYGTTSQSARNFYSQPDGQPKFSYTPTNSDPSPLLPTPDLGTESDQVPRWLAEFVSGSGNQDPIFEFPAAENYWMNKS